MLVGHRLLLFSAQRHPLPARLLDMTSRSFAVNDSARTTLVVALFLLLATVMLSDWIFAYDRTAAIENDYAQMSWNLWYGTESILHGDYPLSTHLWHYPIGANLSKHTFALGFFPVGVITKALMLGSPLYPFYAFRACLVISFGLLAACSYLFLRGLRFTISESILPSIAYAYSNFYMGNIGHLNHISGFFIPLTALLTLRLYQKPGGFRLMVLAVALGTSLYFTEFALFIYITLGLGAGILCMTTEGRNAIRNTLTRIGAIPMMAAIIVFLVIVAPFLQNFFSYEVLEIDASTTDRYSANVAGFFVPDVARTAIYGDIFRGIGKRVSSGYDGGQLFLGFPFILTIAFGLANTKYNSWSKMALFLAVFFFLLSLGPTLKVLSSDTGIPMIYYWLRQVPPFDIFRTPLRFTVITMACLTVFSAFGLRKIRDIAGKSPWRHMGSGVIIVLTAWTLVETYDPIPRTISPSVYPVPKAAHASSLRSQMVPGPVVDLPLEWTAGNSVTNQIFHQQPALGGWLARRTPEQLSHYLRLAGMPARELVKECELIGFRNAIISKEISPYLWNALSDSSLNIIDMREFFRVEGLVEGAWISRYFGIVDEEGAPYETKGVFRFGSAGELAFRFNTPIMAGDFSILADGNDVYSVTFLQDGRDIVSLSVPAVAGTGLRWRHGSIPSEYRSVGFNSIVISPVEVIDKPFFGMLRLRRRISGNPKQGVPGDALTNDVSDDFERTSQQRNWITNGMFEAWVEDSYPGSWTILSGSVRLESLALEGAYSLRLVTDASGKGTMIDQGIPRDSKLAGRAYVLSVDAKASDPGKLVLVFTYFVDGERIVNIQKHPGGGNWKRLELKGTFPANMDESFAARVRLVLVAEADSPGIVDNVSLQVSDVR